MNPNDGLMLLVDDSEADVLLMQVVFDRAGFGHLLQVATDGNMAVSYLRGEARYADRQAFPFPAVVLLDLNMPRRGGFEVLSWIRLQPDFPFLRVYVLSTSKREEDVRRAYASGAHAYLVKPGTLDGLRNLTTTLLAWNRLSGRAGLLH